MIPTKHVGAQASHPLTQTDDRHQPTLWREDSLDAVTYRVIAQYGNSPFGPGLAAGEPRTPSPKKPAGVMTAATSPTSSPSLLTSEELNSLRCSESSLTDSESSASQEASSASSPSSEDQQASSASSLASENRNASAASPQLPKSQQTPSAGAQPSKNPEALASRTQRKPRSRYENTAWELIQEQDPRAAVKAEGQLGKYETASHAKRQRLVRRATQFRPSKVPLGRESEPLLRESIWPLKEQGLGPTHVAASLGVSEQRVRRVWAQI